MGPPAATLCTLRRNIASMMKICFFFILHIFSVSEMLKVKEDVTRERDSLLKEVATLRGQMESVSAAQQRAEDDIEQAELKITEVNSSISHY